eukprot:IDg3489t1
MSSSDAYAEPAMSRSSKRYEAYMYNTPTSRENGAQVWADDTAPRPCRLQKFHEGLSPVISKPTGERARKSSRRNPNDQKTDPRRKRIYLRKQVIPSQMDDGWGDWLKNRLSNRRVDRHQRQQNKGWSPSSSHLLKQDQYVANKKSRQKRSNKRTPARKLVRRSAEHRPSQKSLRKKYAQPGENQRVFQEPRVRKEALPKRNKYRRPHPKYGRRQNDGDVIPLPRKLSGSEVCRLSRRHPYDRFCRPLANQ